MKYIKQKLPGFKSGINYEDLESEIARVAYPVDPTVLNIL